MVEDGQADVECVVGVLAPWPRPPPVVMSRLSTVTVPVRRPAAVVFVLSPTLKVLLSVWLERKALSEPERVLVAAPRRSQSSMFHSSQPC